MQKDWEARMDKLQYHSPFKAVVSRLFLYGT